MIFRVKASTSSWKTGRLLLIEWLWFYFQDYQRCNLSLRESELRIKAHGIWIPHKSVKELKQVVYFRGSWVATRYIKYMTLEPWAPERAVTENIWINEMCVFQMKPYAASWHVWCCRFVSTLSKVVEIKKEPVLTSSVYTPPCTSSAFHNITCISLCSGLAEEPMRTFTAVVFLVCLFI